MALEFILPAVNLHLIDRVPMLNKQNCSIEPDGRPPAYATEFHVAIDESGTTPGGDYRNEHIDEVHDVLVVVSVRMGRFATDKTGDAYTRTGWVKNLAAFAPLEQAIKKALHGDHQCRQIAVEMAQGSIYNFATPLYYLGRSRTEKKGLDWDGGAAAGRVAADDMPWLARTLRFRGFQTFQRLVPQAGPG